MASVLIHKLNNATNDAESDMLSSKFYEENEMTALFKNKNKIFLFISLKPFYTSISLWKSLKFYQLIQFEFWFIKPTNAAEVPFETQQKLWT